MNMLATEKDEEPLGFDDAEDCGEASQQTQTAVDTTTVTFIPAKAHQPTGLSVWVEIRGN